MTRTHVLIDLDGTLSDSSVGIGRSLQHAFAACGFEPPTDRQIHALIGPPFEQTLPKLGIPVSELKRVIHAYRERYEDIGLYENDVYPGIAEMLVDLSDCGYTLAIATAKPQVTAVRIVEHFGFTEHFTVQAGATIEVGSGRRTKADVIEYALEELEIEAGEHVIMVGDRDHDVEGALHNDVECIGVTWGFGTHRELTDAGAMIVVDSPAEVVSAVASTYRSVRP